jgi:hypothetical protein
VPYQQAGEQQLAPYVTANVNLWPRTLALFANPGRLARLSASQRRLLDQAAADTAGHSTGLVQDETRIVSDMCQAGARFASASAADLAALRQRLAPVYARLEADPQTKAMIEQITALKRSTPAGPALTVPAACAGRAPGQPEQGTTVTSQLNGTYRWVLSKHDASTAPPDVNNVAMYPVTFTATLKDGIWKMRDAGSEVHVDTNGDTYSIQGNRIMFHWTGNNPLTFAYSVDGQGNLHLTPASPMDPSDAFVWTTHPWTKIG